VTYCEIQNQVHDNGQLRNGLGNSVFVTKTRDTSNAAPRVFQSQAKRLEFIRLHGELSQRLVAENRSSEHQFASGMLPKTEKYDVRLQHASSDCSSECDGGRTARFRVIRNKYVKDVNLAFNGGAGFQPDVYK
jgi:hypothetical protein